jgi:hypothetical protein
MQKDPTTQTIAQKTLKLFLGCLILFLVIFALYWCNSKPHPFIKPNNNDSINNAISNLKSQNSVLIKNNKSLRTEIDSLSNLKPKVIVRYKTIYDSLLVVDSTCVRSLNLLYNECQKVDSVNNQIITNQETHIMNDSHIIGNLADIIALKQTRISNDSLTIDDLTMTVKKEKRKGKLKTILGTALGTLAGFGLGSLR